MAYRIKQSGVKDMTTGETLKYLRIKAGISQQELSYLTKVSNHNICLYETGKVEPRFDVMCKLIKAMGYEIEIKERK